MSLISAIAFDLDDTLFLEKDFVFSGYHAVAERVNSDLELDIYSNLVDLFELGKHVQAFELALKGYLGTVSEEYILSLVNIYRGHKPNLSPFPEVIDALIQLKQDYKLALVSDGHELVQQRKLQSLDIQHYFDAVVFSDKWGKPNWKPAVRPYKECANILNVNVESIVYVGDNPSKDFVGARGLGMATVRVRREGTLHYDMSVTPSFDADYEISNLDELGRVLSQIESDGDDRFD